MPDTPPESAGDVKIEPTNDQNASASLSNLDDQPAKRPRLDADESREHRPILSSSYRPRKRPDPIPTHLSIPSPTTASSTSSRFQSENIITPQSSFSTYSQQNNNHYHPNSSSSSSYPTSAIPSTSFLASQGPDVKPILPPLPPIVHSLPPRPQVPLPPANTFRAGQTPELAAVPISSPATIATRDDVKVESEGKSTSPRPDPPSAEEIRRRADEVIARLMGSALSPATPVAPSAPSPAAASASSDGDQSLEKKAEDVIARLERETRAREAAVPVGMFIPPHLPHGLPGRPPIPMYPFPGGMMPPLPPPGWRPPMGFGPPPGWRPPGPMITRFPRPPFAPPPAHMSPHHISPPNLPPSLPLAISPATSISALPSPRNLGTPPPQASNETPAQEDMPVLLPKKRKSTSVEPPAHVQPKPQNQVYIGNLPATTQLATLRKAFEALSPILTIELRAPYAMIEFEEDGMAQQAVEVYDEGTFGGVQIRVERASD
jgi:hypothetical protein